MPSDQEYSPLPTINMDAPIQMQSKKSHNSFGYSFNKFIHRPKYVLGSVAAMCLFVVLGFGLLAAMTSINQNTDDRSQASEGFEINRAIIGGKQTDYNCADRYGDPERLGECEALVDLYNSTNGDEWRDKTGWLTAADYCTWFGITCVESTIQRVDLTNNALIGTLPQSLDSLIDLKVLYLNSNSLSGTIPDSIGLLINLESIYLNSNALSGTIPASLGSLTNLVALILNNNNFSGEFPRSIVQRSSLRAVSFSGQLTNGQMPYVDTNICVSSETRAALVALEARDPSQMNVSPVITDSIPPACGGAAPTNTPTPTPTITPTRTPTPTVTPTPTQMQSPPTRTPTPTRLVTRTPTPTVTPVSGPVDCSQIRMTPPNVTYTAGGNSLFTIPLNTQIGTISYTPISRDIYWSRIVLGNTTKCTSFYVSTNRQADQNNSRIWAQRQDQNGCTLQRGNTYTVQTIIERNGQSRTCPVGTITVN